MAKHSHWDNIKHKKAANDKKKAAVISKMGKLITVAVQLGGPHLNENPRLRLAVDKARSAKMNMDAIERAIIMADGNELDSRDFFFLSAKPSSEKVQASSTLNLDDMERNTIQRAIDKNGGNISKAAKELGLTRASLYRRLEKYGL